MTLSTGFESRWDMDVAVIQNATPEWDIGRVIASTTFRRDSLGRMRSFVTLYRRELTSTVRFLALLHEFGHVLGLAHDVGDESVMRPRQPEGSTRIVGFTEADRNLLNSLYCASVFESSSGATSGGISE
jgi:hypothetical protein